MTRTINNLIDFMNELKKIGYRTQIPIQHLRFFIAKHIGTSDYVQKSVLKNLLEFGFLKEAGIGVFYVCDGWEPGDKKTVQEAEKEAEKEADALLDKVKKSE